MTAQRLLLGREKPRPMADGRVLKGALVCTLCARTPAVATGRLRGRVTVKLNRPEDADAVRRMRCPACAGRLLLDETEEVIVRERVPLTEDEKAPKRGRPPKAPPPVPPEPGRPCADCGTPTTRHRASLRCRPCNGRHQGEAATAARLVVLLGHGRPVPAADITVALGVTLSAIRSAVKRLRDSGRRIGSSGAGRKASLYWLEGEAS